MDIHCAEPPGYHLSRGTMMHAESNRYRLHNIGIIRVLYS